MTHLALILSFDRPGARRWRACGKVAVASLLRALWDGEVRLVRNYEQPLFPTGRRGLSETLNPGFDFHHRMLGWRREAELGAELEQAGLGGEAWQRQVAKEAARLLQFEEIAMLERPEDFEWILLADADCVALRNLDHLFDRDEEVLVTDRTNPDPGFVAVRGRLVKDLAVKWRAARESRHGREGGHGQDLAATLASGTWRVGQFERREVVRADAPGVSLTDLSRAAVVHFGGLTPTDKQRLACGFHLMTVYGDEGGLVLDMLES